MKCKLQIYIKNKLTRLKEFVTKKENAYFFIVFIISLAIHLYISLIGWDNPILDQYGFRQTQTAISTYYTIKEGFKFHYITPVMGAPWSIPLEFPLFQWIVAAIVMTFKTTLDQTGGFVSLMFFYLLLVPLYAILKTYLKKRNLVFITLSLILLNPTYLFWSRTFMIESLALFLGISYIWLAIKAFSAGRWNYFGMLAFAGSLAALVKITTFFVLCIPIGFLFIFLYFKESNRLIPTVRIFKKYALYAIITFIIPLIVGLAWTHFADEQKNVNPLANGFITSNALTGWNFGTLQQKTDPSVWSTIFKNSLLFDKTFGTMSFGTTVIPNSFVLLILFLLFSKIYRKEVILLFVLFLSGPLIFTNLFFVHTYYFYANSFYLSILLGFVIIAVYKNSDVKIKYLGTYVLFPALLISMIYSYQTSYYPSQITKSYAMLDAASAVKKYTNPDDVIFIYGQDWDPSFPYYAQRKAIMDWKKAPLNDKTIKKSIKKTGTISAFVISNMTDEEFIRKQVQYLGFNEIPAYMDSQTRIYLPK